MVGRRMAAETACVALCMAGVVIATHRPDLINEAAAAALVATMMLVALESR